MDPCLYSQQLMQRDFSIFPRNLLYWILAREVRRNVSHLTSIQKQLTSTHTDGNVTQNLSTLFRRVVTTEVSLPMCKRLRNRGWECIQTDLPSRTNINHETFDVVSLLNVLDRCDRPRTLLQRIRELMKPQGRLLLAVVLPFCPFVESGVRKLQPRELYHSVVDCALVLSHRSLQNDTHHSKHACLT